MSDPALVVVSYGGPIDRAFWPDWTYSERHRMFRQVAAVEPTSFALPLDIRVDSHRERHSVSVIAPDGRSDSFHDAAWLHVGTLGPYRGAELRQGFPTWRQRLRYCLYSGLNAHPPGLTVVWADDPRVTTASG